MTQLHTHKRLLLLALVSVAVEASVIGEAAGKLLDYGTPVMSIADAISDNAVCYQYYKNAKDEGVEPIFFKMSCVLLLISALAGVVMTFVFMGKEMREAVDSFLKSCPCGDVRNAIAYVLLFVLAILMLPLGQFLPLYLYLAAKRADTKVIAEPQKPRPPPKKEECLDIQQWNQRYVEWFQHDYCPYVKDYNMYVSEVVEKKIKTHLPLVVETGIEAVPQSLLQNSSIVIYSQRSPEALSWLQFVSMGTSIMAIMSKAYVACNSILQELFTFKMLCICCDISGLFYTSAALWQVRRGDSDAVGVFFLTRPVDPASAVWVYAYASLGAMGAIFLLLYGTLALILIVIQWYREDTGEFRDLYDALCSCAKNRSCVIRSAAATVAIVIFVLLMYGAMVLFLLMTMLPGMLVAVSSRLSYIIIWLKRVEGEMEHAKPFYIAAYTFFNEGSDNNARMCAINHVMQGKKQAAVRMHIWLTGCAIIKDNYRFAVQQFEHLLTDGRLDKTLFERVGLRFLSFWFASMIVLLTISSMYSVVYPFLAVYLEITRRPNPNVYRLSLFGISTILVFTTVCYFLIKVRRFCLFAQYVDLKTPVGDWRALISEIENVYEKLYKYQAETELQGQGGGLNAENAKYQPLEQNDGIARSQ